MAKKPWLSVVIPALNEARDLAATLRSVQGEDVEVLVVDGGSQDETGAIARDMGAVVVASPCGRGVQMNYGAQQAQGDILLFLHADTCLPPDYISQIRACLARKEIVAGAFRLGLTGKGLGLQIVAWGANLRSKWLGLVYGDQGVFLSRAMFEACGGFADVPIMEDFILVQQLKRKGRIGLSDARVQSSGRRWQRRGLIWTTLINQIIILGFFLGLSPHFLAKIYGVRKKV